MSGTWDATVTLVYAVNDGGRSAIGTISNGDAFDVVADVRIGRNLMQFVDGCELFVSVRNLSRSSTLATRHQSYALAPQDAELEQHLHAKVDTGWRANEGDVLEALATFKVTAGVNHDYTQSRSAPFIVSL